MPLKNNEKMRTNLRNKILRIFISVLVAFSYTFVLPASVVMAQEATPSTQTTSTTQEVNWKDPNNWYQQWKAGQEAKKAAAEAAAAAAAINSNTGADSYNEAGTNTNNTSNTDINNTAKIDNLVEGDSNTGDNSANKNTGNGLVNTGNASLAGNVETTANTISIGSVGSCGSGGSCGTVSIKDLEAANDKTGSGSFNMADNNTNNETGTSIDNDADLYNYVDFDSNTGNNSADKNTGNGIVTTGDSDVILTAVNTANNVNVGASVFNVMDDQTGDIVIDYSKITPTYIPGGGAFAGNNATGEDSLNSATNTSNNSNTILVDNFGNLINNYDLTSNTGNNTADKNTGNGSVTTGDANIAFNLINFLNNVFLGGGGELLLGVVNIFGTLDGDIVLKGINEGGTGTNGSGLDLLAGNSTTGAGSENTANNSTSNNTSIDLNNLADVQNNVNLNGNTGGNDASKNTGGGYIDTGDVDANLNVSTVANTSAVGSGGDIWMVLINNMGSWTGQLFGGEQGSVYSPFFTFTVNPDGSIVAANDTTGADSFNEAANNVENETDITVNNTGTLVNNVNLNANTGDNSASYNTGSGSIKTGDVNIAANIANFLNNTFIGSRFLLTIVNIFGQFNGDIVNGEKTLSGVNINEPLSKSASSSKSSSRPTSSTINGANQTLLAFGAASGPSLETNGGSNTAKSPGDADVQTLVLGTDNDGQAPPIARFNSERGLFDDFNLMNLMYPVALGIVFSLTRRALFKGVKR
ncbi:MAG: hypothetical protein WD187_00935 [Candidatus Woykebacteria bacterium]